MSERTFKLPVGHPGCSRVCYRCNKAIGSGVDVYLDQEAPRSAEDAVRMKRGDSYISASQLVHVNCTPRSVTAILNNAELLKAS